MSLGVVCHWLDNKDNNLLKTASLQLGAYRLGKYTENQIINTYLNNINTHIKNLPVIIAQQIKVFRLTSSLLPLADRVPADLWKTNPCIIKALTKLGDIVKSANMRITTHPGQFVVLSSDNPQVILNSIKELETHAWIFDMMELAKTPYYSINIHGGKKNRTTTLVKTISSLPDNIRNRLTLENDESAYSVPQLLEVNQKTGVPIVLDTHHYTFNSDGLSLEETYKLATSTWGYVKPLQHISNTAIGLEQGSFQERRKHAAYIHQIPGVQLQAMQDNSVDVEVEAKAKQKAVFKLIKDFDITL
jgi:UV DNA damage endonuclease